MNKSWRKLLAVIACFGLFNAGAVLAEDAPSGTVQIVSKSVAVGVGVTWGKGTLTFQGKSYDFSVDGLTVVDLGISKITTTGEVFNLKSAADLDGHYVAGAAGIAIATGINDVIMRNDHGVVLRLRGTEKGVRLQLGASGVNIKMPK